MTDLLVFVDGRLAGGVDAGRGKSATFSYDDSYLRSGRSTPLSLSAPLTRRRHEIGTWIDGLLPDNAEVRRRWADRNAAVSTRPVDLLSTPIGLDCAGAVQFCRPGNEEALRSRAAGVEWQSEHGIAEWVRQVRVDWSRWGGIGTHGQFSLGGAQAKCALHWDGRRWGVPYGDMATTHILKPGLEDFEDAEVVEHVCLSAAHRLGLEAAHTDLVRFESERVVAVTRFDRAWEGDELRRRHQEDLCQALGRSPDEKYQSDGGPSPEAVADLLSQESSDPRADTGRFRDALIFNWAIAAPDAHAKNYSLFLDGSDVSMAPLYDVISYLPYGRGRPHWKMRTAMRIGKDYTLRKSSRPSAWERTARAMSLDPEETVDRAAHLIQRTPAAVSDAIDALAPEDRKSPVLSSLHRLAVVRSKDVLGVFARQRPARPATTGQGPQARTRGPNRRAVTCGARLAGGSTCGRRLSSKACPFHPDSSGSRAIRSRDQPPQH